MLEEFGNLKQNVIADGRLAQLEERLPYTEEVEGSNPLIAHHFQNGSHMASHVDHTGWEADF